ncbi:putative reverse transcriptase domain-containing protein [Tanacetum coccineum]
MLFRDRRAHAYTRHQMETEARLSRVAWRRSMDASDLARGEVMLLCTTVLGQMSEIRELHATDRRRQAGQVAALQGKVTALQGQQGPAGGPAQPEEVARDANRNGDDSHTSGTGGRRTERVVRECTYQDFMKCKPLYFKGTKGVVELTQWFERMETVFRISNCSVENQIKFSTMVYISSSKGTDVIGYNQRFQELALLCVRMFPEESDKIERYVGGLPDMIHGNIVASKPKTMQEAVEMATELMDKKVITIAERQAENKRKSAGSANNANNQRGTGSGQKPTCFECGVQGHFKRECPKLKNNKNVEWGIQVGNAGTQPKCMWWDMQGQTQILIS